MKKFIAVFILSLLLIQAQVTFAAAKYSKVFEFKTESKKTFEDWNGKSYKEFTGTGTELTPEKLSEMTEINADYYLQDGNKKYPIKSIYFPGDYQNIYLTYYKNEDANSNPLYTVTKLENEKMKFSGTKSGKNITLFKKKLDLKEVETTGTIEQNMTLNEGEGVQSFYTTDWKDEFKDIESKLVKIYSSRQYGDGLRQFIFTYKKGGYGSDYEACKKNKKMPFCFKKEGDKLMFSSRGQISESIGFWFKK